MATMKLGTVDTTPVDSHAEVRAAETAERATAPPAGTGPSAVSRLHTELDGMVGRSIGDQACREAMLDALLRCQSFAGGAWFLRDNGRLAADVVRLPSPIFERKEVSQWIADLANRAIIESKDIVGLCPMVRNIKVLAVPTITERRAETRPGTMTMPERALIIATTGTESRGDDNELLAAQCVVRAYRDWFVQQKSTQWREQLLATSSLLDLVGQISRSDSTKAACQTLVNVIQNHFHASFAAVALQNPGHSIGRLQAVSGIGDFDATSQHAVRLEAALNEAMIRQEVTEYPTIGKEQNQHLAHKRIAGTASVDAVISVPITNKEQAVVGAVLLGGAAHQLLQDRVRNVLRAAQQPIGEAICLSQQLEGGWFRRTTRRVNRFARKGRGMLTLAAIGLVGAAMFLPVSYRIGCRCQVEPVSRRFALAPYDGMLENTYFEPGDEVHAGEIVARMEGRELSWELAGLTAEVERAGKRRDVYRADLAVADSIIADLELEKLLAREELLRERLEKLDLRSPVDGIVLSGSLDRREHVPVRTGQLVYEIAPLNNLRIEIAVPAAERPHIEPGMTVSIRMDGTAGDVVTGEIQRILPRSEIRNEQNVFIAEVLVDNPDGYLKPGMEGSVQITSHRHPLGWTIGHHAWERLIARVWW